MRRPKIAFQTTRAGTFWSRAARAKSDLARIASLDCPMISSMDAQRLVVSALLSFVACGSAAAIDWPKTYVVAEDTTSADGKYALIVQRC